jgi:hypothetical protein
MFHTAFAVDLQRNRAKAHRAGQPVGGKSGRNYFSTRKITVLPRCVMRNNKYLRLAVNLLVVKAKREDEQIAL